MLFFCTSWTLLMCYLRFACGLKALPHKSHLWFFGLSWIFWMYFLRVPVSLKALSHNHIYYFLVLHEHQSIHEFWKITNVNYVMKLVYGTKSNTNHDNSSKFYRAVIHVGLKLLNNHDNSSKFYRAVIHVGLKLQSWWLIL